MIEQITLIVYAIASILVWIAFIYFFYTVSYSFILSVAGYFYKTPLFLEKTSAKKIAIFIPAYKEDGVIIEAAQAAIDHNYPNDKFDVIVIADSLQKITMDKLTTIDRLIVMNVDFENSTKVKALNFAFSKVNDSYDIGVILDADNIMQEGFLNKINSFYVQGHLAIQGQRVAKNKNNSMAILDGLSEAINNHIYREGTASLGLSCSFIGSGMAIDFNLMKSTLNQMGSIGGFDRDMEVRLIDKGHTVKYLKNAIVYDEKVESSKVFANQRKRWIYSQYLYLFKEFIPGIKQLLKGNFSYFNSAVLRNVQLPRLINIGLLFIIAIGALIIPGFAAFPFFIWASLLVVLVLSNAMAIPKSLYNLELGKALLSLPKVFFIMFLLLFKLRGANKKFIHTPHTKVSE